MLDYQIVVREFGTQNILWEGKAIDWYSLSLRQRGEIYLEKNPHCCCGYFEIQQYVVIDRV